MFVLCAFDLFLLKETLLITGAIGIASIFSMSCIRFALEPDTVIFAPHGTKVVVPDENLSSAEKEILTKLKPLSFVITSILERNKLKLP